MADVPLILLVATIAGVISILLAVYFRKLVLAEDPGNRRMQEVAGYIEEGANTYLKVQYNYKVMSSCELNWGQSFFILLSLVPTSLVLAVWCVARCVWKPMVDR